MNPRLLRKKRPLINQSIWAFAAKRSAIPDKGTMNAPVRKKGFKRFPLIINPKGILNKRILIKR
jgi:hypothetical protein